jgi:hypothetical protein
LCWPAFGHEARIKLPGHISNAGREVALLRNREEAANDKLAYSGSCLILIHYPIAVTCRPRKA